MKIKLIEYFKKFNKEKTLVFGTNLGASLLGKLLSIIALT